MDIKADNILINDKTKELKISDFGTSKKFEAGEPSMCVSGLATPLTASPEMVSGEAFGRWNDTWALGCILYQMCTFKHPFGSLEDVRQMVQNILQSEPDYDLIPKEYSSKTTAFIKLFLTKDPDKRPKVAEIFEKLEKHANKIIHKSSSSK